MRYVYTSITAGRDLPGAPGPLPAGWRAVCFSDGGDHPDWEVRAVTEEGGSPIRNTRMHKLLPQRFLPDAEISLWIDANWTVACNLDRLVETYLDRADAAFHRHPQRDCVYDEAEACVRLKKADPEAIAEQVRRYRSRGYPRHNGLVATGIVLRRHTAPVERFCRRWWEELAAGSHRDQLSCSVALFETGLPFALFDWDLWDNPNFIRRPHHGPGAEA